MTSTLFELITMDSCLRKRQIATSLSTSDTDRRIRGRRREWELGTDNGTDDEFGNTIGERNRDTISGKGLEEREHGLGNSKLDLETQAGN